MGFLLRLVYFFDSIRTSVKLLFSKNSTWEEALFIELTKPNRQDYSKLGPKTAYIEKTLDWSERRQAELLKNEKALDAMSVSSEFMDWLRAPEGFDHDILMPSGEKK